MLIRHHFEWNEHGAKCSDSEGVRRKVISIHWVYFEITFYSNRRQLMFNSYLIKKSQLAFAKNNVFGIYM